MVDVFARPLFIALPALLAATTPSYSQELVAAFSQTPQGDLISQDESGHRNIPNFRFDGRHTAGGLFMITDTNWRHYAPQLDIDLGKYPNAMSASEQLQGQVAGKMFAETGYMPWICCNKQLREHLDQPPLVRIKHLPPSEEHETHPSAAAVDAKPTDPFATESSSFLITNQEGN
jgi:hypothetical protein